MEEFLYCYYYLLFAECWQHASIAKEKLYAGKLLYLHMHMDMCMNMPSLLPQIPVSRHFSVSFCTKSPYRSDAWVERQPKTVRMDLIKDISVYLLE